MPPLIDERGLIGIIFPRNVDATGSDAMQRLLIPTCVCSIAVKLIFLVMLFDLRFPLSYTGLICTSTSSLLRVDHPHATRLPHVLPHANATASCTYSHLHLCTYHSHILTHTYTHTTHTPRTHTHHAHTHTPRAHTFSLLVTYSSSRSICLLVRNRA